MITLVRIEAEAYELADVIADLDAIEKSVMAHQHKTPPGYSPPDGGDPPFDGPVPLNTRVMDEHYERINAGTKGKNETHFKGRRVIRFVGRAAWDDNTDMDAPQPRLSFTPTTSSSMSSGTNGTYHIPSGGSTS